MNETSPKPGPENRKLHLGSGGAFQETETSQRSPDDDSDINDFTLRTPPDPIQPSIINTRLNRFYFRFALLGSVLYCIPILFLLFSPRSSNLWLPYLGNGIFICFLVIAILYINRRAADFAGLRTLLIGGMKITVLSIVVSCILILVMLAVFHEKLQQPPVIRIQDGTNGFTSILLFNAIIVNFPGGAFATLIGSIAVKHDQKTDFGNELE
ncbi:MAG TPA: hypothetical protein VMV20_02050 [Chitinophagaceae bacterium]|nr:hypothetical protein [Chitinophagaceae bacterium]